MTATKQTISSTFRQSKAHAQNTCIHTPVHIGMYSMCICIYVLTYIWYCTFMKRIVIFCASLWTTYALHLHLHWFISALRAFWILNITFNYTQICIHANFKIKTDKSPCKRELFLISVMSIRNSSKELQDMHSLHGDNQERNIAWLCTCMCLFVWK